MTDDVREILHFHMACGLGGGARGFNQGKARIGNMVGRFRCLGGVDVDPAAIADFDRLAGVKGTVLDLFSREQYAAFHGREPPADYREAMTTDIIRAAGGERPHIVFSSFPCLPASGLVLTEAGNRQISTIEVGDRVLTHRGRYRAVTKVMTRRYQGQMHGLRLNGTVDRQWFTDEHPLWVRRVVRRGLGRTRQLDAARFMDAKDVRPGDRVGFPVEEERPGAFSDWGAPFGLAFLPGETIWFLLGAYLGDGYRTGGTVRFCVGPVGGDLAQRVREALDRLGWRHSTDASGGATNVKIVTSAKRLHALCGEFGDGAENKRLPAALFGMPRAMIDHLVAGYFATDGSSQGERRGPRGNRLQARWKIASVSLQLLRDMQRLLLRTGVFASVHRCWPGGPQTILGRLVQTRERWEINVRLDPTKRTIFEFADGAIWVRVRDIERSAADEPVWNIAVDEDDTYCAPMVATHNCKGFSGLLSEKTSGAEKYQALNALTLRGMWLVLEAWADDPMELLIFENVPRIATRGRWLLDQITALLRHYGYAYAETKHNCGELGGLAQSRERFLLVARHREKVPPFLYEAPKRPLRGVGEVLDRLWLPGDERGGPMHRVPRLQWKTWVRLAFVEAGSDWRSLNKLAIADGQLRDFGIVPDVDLRNGAYGVAPWEGTAGAVQGESLPSNGKFAVADPRPTDGGHAGNLGVTRFGDPAVTISADARPTKGKFAVADPRPMGGHDANLGVTAFDQPVGTIKGKNGPTNGPYAVADPREDAGRHHGAYGVQHYGDPSGVVRGSRSPGSGVLSVADPRIDGHEKSVQHGVGKWDKPAATIKGDVSVGTGRYAVADPRVADGRPIFNNCYRIVPWAGTSPAVAGPGGAGGGLAVADPRPPPDEGYKKTKYRVTAMDEAAGSVIGASTTGNGAFAVADPRMEHPGEHTNKLVVGRYEDPARAVIGTNRGPGSGALSVADPRPEGMRDRTEGYMTQGHYGVARWEEPSRAVTASGQADNGAWSVADPRPLPRQTEHLVCVIRALDGTWHRPFTTLELAALQSLFDPDDALELSGHADSLWRERIGNAVPSAAAAAIASTMGRTLLLAWSGSSFMLSEDAIWVRPLEIALAVDTSNQIPDWAEA